MTCLCRKKNKKCKNMRKCYYYKESRVINHLDLMIKCNYLRDADFIIRIILQKHKHEGPFLNQAYCTKPYKYEWTNLAKCKIVIYLYAVSIRTVHLTNSSLAQYVHSLLFLTTSASEIMYCLSGYYIRICSYFATVLYVHLIYYEYM